MAGWRERIRSLYQRVVRLAVAPQYSAHERALGAALGVGVGLLPVAPLQLLLLASVCLRVRCHRALAFVTVWILNPFTIVPLYAAEYWCGQLLCERWFGTRMPLEELVRANVVTLVRRCPRELLALACGGVVFSAAAAVLMYFIVRAALWCMAPSRTLAE